MKYISLFFLLSLVGCHLSPNPDDLVKSMLVQTTYDENTAYDFYTTFTLSDDTIGFLSNAYEDTLLTDGNNGYTHRLTQAIKTHMALAGYTYVNKNQNPDLGFAATWVQNYNVFQSVSYPSYYYSGYYGYGYGGYYGNPVVSTYSTSVDFLIIHLIDLKNRDAQGRLKVIWTAYIGDLKKSSDPNGQVLIAIAQAFKQTPKLHKP